jgi:hypothetical protein
MTVWRKGTPGSGWLKFQTELKHGSVLLGPDHLLSMEAQVLLHVRIRINLHLGENTSQLGGSRSTTSESMG